MTLTNKEQKIIDTHREILWLKRQIEEYEDEDKIELPEVSEETEENIKNGIDMYSNHINSMRVQIEIATLRNKNQEAILKALFERCFLRNALFSDKEVKKYINQRDKFVNKFMALYLTLKENTSELTKLQMESMQLHTENQERSRKVLELKREIDDIIMTGNTKGLHQSKIEQKNYIATIRGVLNGLILETGLNSVDDKQILAITTRLGEEL